MKILYTNTVGSWGGVATYLRPLLKDQINRHNKVYLLTGTNGELTNWVSNKLPEVKVIILPTLKRNIHILDTLKAIFQFRKIVKNINPDIIHLNCIMSGIVGRLGSIGLSPKIVYNAHGWAFEPRVSKKIRLCAIVVEKLLSYLTDKIICVSDYEYRIALKYHIFKNEDQAVIIKNGAPKVNMNKSNKLYDNIYRITMAARFMEPKDQAKLIKAFNILDKDLLPSKNIRLYLLGNGPNLRKCKILTNKLHQKDIIFTGEVTNVLDYYNQSNIVTLITRSDAISLSLIEALSIGKPIVASDVGGVPEVFCNNGFCVSNNIQIIANAFYKLLNNYNMRKCMGKNSLRLFCKKFDITKDINKHALLYKRLLNG